MDVPDKRGEEMSDMINRDEVLAIIADLKKDYPTHSVPDAEAKVALRKVADKIRTIDAVCVVRCKECKWFDAGENESDSWHLCTRHFGKYINFAEDNYCSYGERRTDE